MNVTREQKQSAYKKLPPEIQDLIMDNETTDLIANTLQEVGLSEEHANLADSEILYAMYCLQTLDEALKNIAKVSGKNVSDLTKIKNVLENEVFSKYKINIKDFVEANKSGSAPTTPVAKPHNLPMIEEGEVVHDARPPMSRGSDGGQVPHVEQQSTTNSPQPIEIKELATNSIEKTSSPAPVPTPPTTPKPLESKAATPDYRYTSGKDPYREPLV